MSVRISRRDANPDITLRSRRTAGSSLSPTKNFNASGTSIQASGLDRTRRATSASNAGTENRSVKKMAIAGSSCQTCPANVVHPACRKGIGCQAGGHSARCTHIEHSLLNYSNAINSAFGVVRRIVPYVQTEDLILDQQTKHLTHVLCAIFCVLDEPTNFETYNNVRGAGLGDRLDRDGLFRPTSLLRQDKNSDRSFTSV